MTMALGQASQGFETAPTVGAPTRFFKTVRKDVSTTLSKGALQPLFTPLSSWLHTGTKPR